VKPLKRLAGMELPWCGETYEEKGGLKNASSPMMQKRTRRPLALWSHRLRNRPCPCSCSFLDACRRPDPCSHSYPCKRACQHQGSGQEAHRHLRKLCCSASAERSCEHWCRREGLRLRRP